MTLLLLGWEAKHRGTEIGLLKNEDARRDDEIDLVREQLETQKLDLLSQEQASLKIVSGIGGTNVPDGLDYVFDFQNEGSAPATNVVAHFRNPQRAVVGSSDPVEELLPGDTAHVLVKTPPTYSGPYVILFEWTDGRGRRRASTNTHAGTP